MVARISLLLFLSLHAATAPQPTPDISVLLGALGTPLCMRNCVSGVADAVQDILTFNNVSQKIKQMCTAYSATEACLKKKVGCTAKQFYEEATAGIRYACITKKAAFDKEEDCLGPSIDGVLQVCDAKCHVRGNLSTLTANKFIQRASKLGGNLWLVAERLESFCDSLTCILPCITDGANSACPKTGWLLLDTLLDPFDKAADFFHKAPKGIQDQVKKSLSPKCHFLFDKYGLLEMRKDSYE